MFTACYESLEQLQADSPTPPTTEVIAVVGGEVGRLVTDSPAANTGVEEGTEEGANAASASDVRCPVVFVSFSTVVCERE
jgi:hypothetical protein